MTTATRKIAFIDSRVADYQTLIDGLAEGTEWFLLDAGTDGIRQMESILSGYSDLDAIEVISHGSQGTLYLGSTVLDSGNLSAYQASLQAIGASLSETGDILLYGCNVAQGDVGLQFIGSCRRLRGRMWRRAMTSPAWTGTGNWKWRAAASRQPRSVQHNGQGNWRHLLAQYLTELTCQGLFTKTIFRSAYGQEGGAGEGWHLLSRDELGLGGLLYSGFFNGEYLFDNISGQAFVAQRGTELALVLRGTDNPSELVGDFALAATLNVFYQQFSLIIAHFKAYVDGFQPFKAFIFGHSLGGAVADMFMTYNSSAVYEAVTFGSPGNQEFVHTIDSRITNIQHSQDPVPKVPLLEPGGVQVTIDLPSLSPGFLDFSEHYMDRYLESARMIPRIEFVRSTKRSGNHCWAKC